MFSTKKNILSLNPAPGIQVMCTSPGERKMTEHRTTVTNYKSTEKYFEKVSGTKESVTINSKVSFKNVTSSKFGSHDSMTSKQQSFSNSRRTETSSASAGGKIQTTITRAEQKAGQVDKIERHWSAKHPGESHVMRSSSNFDSSFQEQRQFTHDIPKRFGQLQIEDKSSKENKNIEEVATDAPDIVPDEWSKMYELFGHHNNPDMTKAQPFPTESPPPTPDQDINHPLTQIQQKMLRIKKKLQELEDQQQNFTEQRPRVIPLPFYETTKHVHTND